MKARRSHDMTTPMPSLKRSGADTTRAADLLKKPYGRLVIPEDDGSFRAEMLEFPGCIAAGSTAPKALSSLEKVAESWIESALANGQSIPTPMDNVDFSGRFVLRLPKSLHQRAAYAAERDGVSLNQFITTAVGLQVGIAEARQFSTVNCVFINSAANFVQNNQVTVVTGLLGTLPSNLPNRPVEHPVSAAITEIVADTFYSGAIVIDPQTGPGGAKEHG
jgi:antitoxin HicB